MSETTPRAEDQLPADIKGLHRQLEEMAARAKASNATAQQNNASQGPVLVIRGK